MGRRAKKSRAAWTFDSLSHGQLWELVLGFTGESDDGCVASCNDLKHDEGNGCPTWFADASEASQAWFSVRDELMAGHGPGVRPAGWWRWEARRPRPSTSEQYTALAEIGELQPWEIAAMRAHEALKA
jgi:hypothetical protein